MSRSSQTEDRDVLRLKLQAVQDLIQSREAARNRLQIVFDLLETAGQIKVTAFNALFLFACWPITGSANARTVINEDLVHATATSEVGRLHSLSRKFQRLINQADVSERQTSVARDAWKRVIQALVAIIEIELAPAYLLRQRLLSVLNGSRSRLGPTARQLTKAARNNRIMEIARQRQLWTASYLFRECERDLTLRGLPEPLTIHVVRNVLRGQSKRPTSYG
jgi:hypothetical protein